MYRDLSRCHDWSVEKGIVNLPISLIGNLKRTLTLSPMGDPEPFKDLSAVSQTLLTRVKLHQRRRLNSRWAPRERITKCNQHLSLINGTTS